MVLVDQHDATLLIEGFDPARRDAGTWWYTPGGGLEPGETHERAAIREVAEETGAALDDVGPVVAERETEFAFEGRTIRQRERYFVVRVARFEPVGTGWTALERRATVGMRWWSPAELAATTARVFPADLAGLVRRAPRAGAGDSQR